MSKIVRKNRPRIRVTLTCPYEERRTDPSFKDSCDLNNIIGKYTKKELMEFAVSSQRFIDTTDVPTYLEALNIRAQGIEAFAQLPSHVRKRFSNNPAEMLAFVSDASNRDEALKLGLLAPQPPKEAKTPPKPAPEASDAE